MKKICKKITIVLLFLLTLSITPAFTACGGKNNQTQQATSGLEYARTDGGYSVSKGTANTKGAVVIPSSYNGLPIKKIADFAFSGCDGMTNITIPNSVTVIGNEAFFGCSILTDITLSTNITAIKDSTFAYCSSLTSITIPTGITIIESNAFAYCSSLTSITIPTGVNTIENNAFAYCSNLTDIVLPNSISDIGSGAFMACGELKNFIIPSSVTYINDHTFTDCSNLTSILIPAGVNYIESYAFINCSALTVYAEAIYQNNWSFYWNYTNRPVVWGCTLSSDKTYVESFTKTSTSIYNPDDKIIAAPYRKDYVLREWNPIINGTGTDYAANEIASAPNGTVLYTIWTKD